MQRNVNVWRGTKYKQNGEPCLSCFDFSNERGGGWEALNGENLVIWKGGVIREQFTKIIKFQ